MMEFARLPLFTDDSILKQIPVHNKELIDELIKKEKGALVLSGHFGNWEYLAAVLAKMNPPLHCVFKQQKNLAVDNTIKKIRTDIGLVPLKIKGGAAKGVITAIKKKEMALIVMDQDAGKKGKFVDFLGKSASTADGPAIIAIKYNVPVIMAFGIRAKNGLIEIHFHKFPDVRQFTNDENGITQFLLEYNKILEQYIHKYPEQWFWMHRRWKSQPL